MVRLTSTLLIATLAAAPALVAAQAFDSESLDTRALAKGRAPPRRPSGGASGRPRALHDDLDDLIVRDFDDEYDLVARDFDGVEDLLARELDDGLELVARANVGPGRKHDLNRPAPKPAATKRRVTRDFDDDFELVTRRKVSGKGAAASTRPPQLVKDGLTKPVATVGKSAARPKTGEKYRAGKRDFDDDFEFVTRQKAGGKSASASARPPAVIKPGKSAAVAKPAAKRRAGKRDFDDDFELVSRQKAPGKAAADGTRPPPKGPVAQKEPVAKRRAGKRELADALEELLARWAEIDELD